VKINYSNNIYIIIFFFFTSVEILSQIDIIPVSEKKPFACSSFLKPSKISSYGPENICDFDQSTAWVEGVKGDGVGEWVALYLGNTQNLKQTKRVLGAIYYGYQKTRETLSNNGAGTSYLISFFVDTRKIFEKIVNTYIYEGEEESDCWGGFGNAKFDFNISDQFSTNGIVWMRIEIKKVRTGLKYKDTAISEVVLNFEGANPYNVKETLLLELKNKNHYEGFYVLNDKQIAVENIYSECGPEISLYEFDGFKWRLKSTKYFNGYWIGELNENK